MYHLYRGEEEADGERKEGFLCIKPLKRSSFRVNVQQIQPVLHVYLQRQTICIFHCLDFLIFQLV